MIDFIDLRKLHTVHEPAFFEDGFRACKVILRLFNGFKDNSFAVVVQISPHQHGVVMFFLSLDIVPVAKPSRPLS